MSIANSLGMHNAFQNVRLGLCAGRHDIPVEGYVFDQPITDVTDAAGMLMHATRVVRALRKEANRKAKHLHLHVYVTGLSVALVAVIRAVMQESLEADIGLTLYHFDRESGEYYPQPVIDVTTCWGCGAELLDTPHNATCPFCGSC